MFKYFTAAVVVVIILAIVFFFLIFLLLINFTRWFFCFCFVVYLFECFIRKIKSRLHTYFITGSRFHFTKLLSKVARFCCQRTTNHQSFTQMFHVLTYVHQCQSIVYGTHLLIVYGGFYFSSYFFF